MKTSVTLILPGLAEVDLALCHRLNKMTSRGQMSDNGANGYEEASLLALGFARAVAGIPAARCCYQADFNESALPGCARADPVSLQAGHDDATLVPAESLALQPEQQAQLVHDLNAHFAEDGLHFSIGRKHRWYVSGLQDASLVAAPVNQVAGRQVARYLRASSSSAAWLRLASEVQMLLHSHPVNTERETAGQLPINALWFWGAGELPPRQSTPSVRLHSDAAFVVGLARLAAVTAFPTAEAAVAINARQGSAREQIVVVDIALLESILSGNTEQQAQTLAWIDQDLLAGAERALWRGTLQRLLIDTCDGQQFVVTRRNLARFWVRSDTGAISSTQRTSRQPEQAL